RCPDLDFKSYTLFESYSDDMSGEQRIFRSEDKLDTSFVVTGVNSGEVRYYQVEVADSAGLTSRGNISEAKSFSTQLYYLFNGNTVEEGGSGFDGINNGVKFVNDRFGNENSAAFFDGRSYIQLPDEIRFKPFKSASIAFWMKTEQKGQFYIMDQRIGSHSPDNYNFGIIFNLTVNGMNRIQFNYPGYNSTREYSLEELPIYKKIHNNEWQHFVFIKDATEEKYLIYINGQYFSRERIKDLDFELNGRLLIGKNYLYKFYNGVFDDLYIFDRRLSEEEIIELYNAVP
ncbi:hypothetical protein GF337_18075, partial [candidate division KSB1 bacterium]|nr:hypothetical protein [candidate division KSB1 bacterium]